MTIDGDRDRRNRREQTGRMRLPTRCTATVEKSLGELEGSARKLKWLLLFCATLIGAGAWGATYFARSKDLEALKHQSESLVTKSLVGASRMDDIESHQGQIHDDIRYLRNRVDDTHDLLVEMAERASVPTGHRKHDKETTR